ncbi:hypothetical protein BT63DRAFT_449676 [Microthyrium microscopicum]|uniref:Peptidase S54 rhomboid domain-containing protein n=1 Tax=Microthyrium microscopicum TaxID=703497 RepID=A0A6A6USF2_9PEZI|nr:hypothetical protein BT63DRAFT_449676 [Microthyrium microscopicum]
MQTSGFTNAPVSQLLVFWVVVASVLASVTDTKYYFYLQIVPQISQWGQFWRLLVWQTCYTNSTEVLFAAMTFYHLRVIERLWGSRKFASFLLLALPFSLLLPPFLLAILRPLTFGRLNYLPAGPTPLIFAILAQYQAAIPSMYTYRIGTASPTPDPPQIPSATITLSSKSTNYFLPLQLALSQFPSAILPAAVGWLIGNAYRSEILPGTSWRVPGWLVGQGSRRDARRVEALRRRMEETEEAIATGVESPRARRP